jgi:hypothetical protein
MANLAVARLQFLILYKPSLLLEHNKTFKDQALNSNSQPVLKKEATPSYKMLFRINRFQL